MVHMSVLTATTSHCREVMSLHKPRSNCLQGLGALPQQLVSRILKAPPILPPEQIRLLPSAFHTAVVHGHYPTIDADRTVRVEVSYLDCAGFAEALWPALSCITSFRLVPGPLVMSSVVAADLGPQLVKLSCLQGLDLSNSTLADEGVRLSARCLWPHLAHLKSIRKLDLSSNDLNWEDAETLGPYLAHLSQIQQLRLSNWSQWHHVAGAPPSRAHDRPAP